MTGPAQEERRTPSRFSRAWWWVRLGLVLAMLAALVWVVEPKPLWRVLAHADYLLALAAVPVVFAAIQFDALRLYLLMLPHGYRQGWWAMVKTNLVVNAVSLVLPGTVGGGTVTWYRVARPDKLYAQTFAGLGVNVLLKFVAISALGAAALALDVHVSDAYTRYILPLALCAAAPLVLFFLMLYTGLTRVFKAANERFVTPLFPKVLGGPGRKVLESIETYRRHPRTVIIGLVCCMAGDIVTAVAVALCLGAVGVTGVSFVRVLWIMAATKASGMLPITMSGLGMPQVTFVGLMVACGVAQERAFAANIINLGVLIPMVLAGMGILLVELRGSGSRQTK